MSVLKILASSNYISVNKTLIKIFGLAESVILGELCSEHEHWEEKELLTDDGMFYCTATKLEDNTGLSEYQQRQAIQSLKNVGILETKLKGLPATKYFKIDENKLFTFLQTSSEKIKELDVEKFNLSNNQSNKNINKKALIDKSINAKSEKTDSEISTFVELYHQICIDLPKCVKLTEKREKAIKKLIKKYSLEDIKAVFTKAQKSSFLTGKNDRGWKADIDFILREDKFISILEGKYDCKSKSKSDFDTYDDERKKVDKIQFREEIKNGKSEKF